MPDTDLNDPEDAFDASDSQRERLRNFVRRLEYVRDHLDDLDDPRIDLDRISRLITDIGTLRDEMFDG